MFACLNILLYLGTQVDFGHCTHNSPVDIQMESLEKQSNATLSYLLRQLLHLSAEVPHHSGALVSLRVSVHGLRHGAGRISADPSRQGLSSKCIYREEKPFLPKVFTSMCFFLE